MTRLTYPEYHRAVNNARDGRQVTDTLVKESRYLTFMADVALERLDHYSSGAELGDQGLHLLETTISSVDCNQVLSSLIGEPRENTTPKPTGAPDNYVGVLRAKACFPEVASNGLLTSC